jgi:hypothetical protein
LDPSSGARGESPEDVNPSNDVIEQALALVTRRVTSYLTTRPLSSALTTLTPVVRMLATDDRESERDLAELRSLMNRTCVEAAVGSKSTQKMPTKLAQSCSVHATCDASSDLPVGREEHTALVSYEKRARRKMPLVSYCESDSTSDDEEDVTEEALRDQVKEVQVVVTRLTPKVMEKVRETYGVRLDESVIAGSKTSCVPRTSSTPTTVSKVG